MNTYINICLWHNGPFSVPHGSFSTESLQTVCLILYTIILIHLFLCVLKQQVLRYFYITFNWNELWDLQALQKPSVCNEVHKWHSNFILRILLYTFIYSMKSKPDYDHHIYFMHRWVGVVKVLICLVKIFSL